MTVTEDLEKKLTLLDQDALTDNVQLEIVLKCISEPLEWFNSSDLATTTALIRHEVWKQHVWNVFSVIIPRWTFALSSTTQRPLLESTLTMTQHSDMNVAFEMARVSFAILIECLSAEQDQASLDTLELYASCLKYLSLNNDVFKVYAQQTQHKDVTFIIQLMCSIPGHLANVFGIQLNQVMYNPQHEWYIDRYISSSYSGKD